MHLALITSIFFIGEACMDDYNDNIRLLIEASAHLIAVADKGQAECTDDNCMSLYGLAKDCGYRIRGSAEREFRAHEAKHNKSV
jgi:hypothetical protein